MDTKEHWLEIHDPVIRDVDEAVADSFSVCLKGYRCKEAGCGRNLKTAKEAMGHDCMDDEDEDDGDCSFYSSDDEKVAIVQDSEDEEGDISDENTPFRLKDGDDELTDSVSEEDEDGLIESLGDGEDDDDLSSYEDLEDNPDMRRIDPCEDEGERSEELEDDNEDTGEDDSEVVNDSSEDEEEEEEIKVVEHLANDAEAGIQEISQKERHDLAKDAELGEIQEIPQRERHDLANDAAPGEIQEVALMEHHDLANDAEPGDVQEIAQKEHLDIEQTHWIKGNDAAKVELYEESHEEVVDIHHNVEEISKEFPVDCEYNDQEDPQPQNGANPSKSLISVVPTPTCDPKNSSATDHFPGFSTPTSVSAPPAENLDTPAESLDTSGESVIIMWHSASSYECKKCGEEGNYLKIENHMQKFHGLEGKMKPDLDFGGQIEYHMCFECEEVIQCDPHFINEHMTSSHRRNLAWYETKYKETLVNIKVKHRPSMKEKDQARNDGVDYETPSKKARVVTSTPITTTHPKIKSKPPIPTLTEEPKPGRKSAKNKKESKKTEKNSKATKTTQDRKRRASARSLTPVRPTTTVGERLVYTAPRRNPGRRSRIMIPVAEMESQDQDQDDGKKGDEKDVQKDTSFCDPISSCDPINDPNISDTLDFHGFSTPTSVPTTPTSPTAPAFCTENLGGEDDEHNKITKGRNNRASAISTTPVERVKPATIVGEKWENTAPRRNPGRRSRSMVPLATTAIHNEDQDDGKKEDNKVEQNGIEGNDYKEASVITSTSVTTADPKVKPKLPISTLTKELNTVRPDRKRSKNKNESTKTEKNGKATKTTRGRKSQESTQYTTPVEMPATTNGEKTGTQEQKNTTPRRNPGRRSRSTLPVAKKSSHIEDQDDSKKEDGEVEQKGTQDKDSRNSSTDSTSKFRLTITDTPTCDSINNSNMSKAVDFHSFNIPTSVPATPSALVVTASGNENPRVEDDDDKPLKSKKLPKGRKSKSRKSIAKVSKVEEKGNEEQTGEQNDEVRSSLTSEPGMTSNVEPVEHKERVLTNTINADYETPSKKVKVETSIPATVAEPKIEPVSPMPTLPTIANTSTQEEVVKQEVDESNEMKNSFQNDTGKKSRSPSTGKKSKSGQRTTRNAWYNNCKYYCPKEEECQYPFVGIRDVLQKHWRKDHGSSSLPDSPRHVVNLYKCKKCDKTCPWNRDGIRNHMRQAHKMSFIEYEKEFHPQETK